MTSQYFDRLETELRRAVPRAAGQADNPVDRAGTPAGRRRRIRFGRPILVLNAMLVLAVVVGLVVALGGRGTTQPNQGHAIGRVQHPSGSSQLAYPQAAVATHARLIQNFAVLRRPQNAADRSWGLGPNVRLARTLAGGYHVLLRLSRLRADQEGLVAGTWVLTESVLGPHRDSSFSDSFLPNTQYTVTPAAAGDHIYASIVPDGVATVTWRFTCVGSCAGVGPRRFTVPVVNNVAVRRIAANTCQRLSDAKRQARKHHGTLTGARAKCFTPTGAVWRYADGSTAAIFPSGFGNLPAPPFIAAETARVRPLVAALQGDEVGDARIGRPARGVTRALTAQLGQAAFRDRARPGCKGESEWVWTSPAVASPLTVYTRDGRFIGYQYGSPVGQIALQRDPGTVLTTSRGVTIGTTVGSARRAYGSSFSTRVVSLGGTPPQTGGLWRAAGDGGTVAGELVPVRYPIRHVTAADPIANISAGQTACSRSDG